MYDLPELHAAHDALWAALAARLRARGVAEVPVALTRADDLSRLWRNPDLLLGQTCGYPLVTQLTDRVRVIATPIYRAPGCAGADHRSALVVSADSRARDLRDLRNGVCAVNACDSNTGMNLLRAMIAPLAHATSFFSNVVVSGSHRQSLHLIAAGNADMAAIDGVTLALLRRIEPGLISAIRVLAWSAASPGLPLITSARTDAATVIALRAALDDVANDAALAEVRAALLLRGFAQVPLEAYARVSSFETAAFALGYPRLR